MKLSKKDINIVINYIDFVKDFLLIEDNIEIDFDSDRTRFLATKDYKGFKLCINPSQHHTKVDLLFAIGHELRHICQICDVRDNSLSWFSKDELKNLKKSMKDRENDMDLIKHIDSETYNNRFEEIDASAFGYGIIRKLFDIHILFDLKRGNKNIENIMDRYYEIFLDISESEISEAIEDTSFDIDMVKKWCLSE